MAPPPADPNAKQTSPLKVILIAMLVLSGCICCPGVVAMFAIPASINYIKREKTAEAHAELSRLAHAVRDTCGRTHAPIAAGPSIAVPGSVKQEGAFTTDPGFTDLGFAPEGFQYYAYAVATDPDGTYLVYAEGDLDGDGIRSRFEIRCARDCRCAALTMENELE